MPFSLTLLPITLSYKLGPKKLPWLIWFRWPLPSGPLHFLINFFILLLPTKGRLWRLRATNMNMMRLTDCTHFAKRQELPIVIPLNPFKVTLVHPWGPKYRSTEGTHYRYVAHVTPFNTMVLKSHKPKSERGPSKPEQLESSHGWRSWVCLLHKPVWESNMHLLPLCYLLPCPLHGSRGKHRKAWRPIAWSFDPTVMLQT